MDDLSVIDHFLDVFSRYIDSGFGLLGGEVAFLTSALVAIDITLAGLFWALGNDDVIARLVKKVLYVGAFAFILGNFNELAGILFRSFAGLGLTASGSTLTTGQFLQPGRLAAIGVDAGRPILAQISAQVGFPEIFHNLVSVTVLLLAWLLVIVSFFILAVQLFVSLIEFKLTTLAGFVLVPFALWNKTAFLAERVLGNVISSGIKILVLAIIVGIGTRLFAEFQLPPGSELTVDQALATMLASLALLGLGIYGPGIATGLVAGAPQLGAGAAAGTALGAAGVAVAAGAAAAGGAAVATRTGSGLVRGASALVNRARGRSESTGAGGGPTDNTPPPNSSPNPGWAQRLRQRLSSAHGASTAAHIVRGSDRGGAGANPSLDDDGKPQ
jgi:type IV secretion system protein TrbL